MLANGTSLGPYRILAPLGQGGMGEVYRARDTRLGRDVAVKVISAHAAHDPDRIRRFEQEARAAGALSHPNVCAIFDIGTHEGSPFVVMELLEGESLRARLKQGPIPARKAIDWAAQAAQGLAAAHEKGIVHRDLKPENLFLTHDGHVKVLDFGLAKLTRPEATAPGGADTLPVAGTQTGEVLGTAGYMAPEQVRGEPVDHRADIFTLGSILYELLTGTRAFAGASFYETSYCIVNEDPPPLSASGREMPAGVEGVVRRCLEKQPRERFQSARDLGFALDSVRESGSVSAAGAARAPERPLVKWGSRAAAVLAGVALVAAISLVVVRQAQRRGGGADPAAETGGVDPKRVVVAIFENRTGEASLDALGRMLADQITDGLSRVGIEVMPTSYVLEAMAAVNAAGSTSGPPRDPGLVAAEATGSGILVSGDYYVNGATLRIQAKITDTVSHRILSAVEPVEGSHANPTESVATVSLKVRDALAARLLGPETLREYASTYETRPPRYEAYAELILAGEANRDYDLDTALAHAKKAVELDPDFVQAHIWLAFAYANRLEYPEALEALEGAQSRRHLLSPIGRLDLDSAAADLTGRRDDAAIAYREIVRLRPGDVAAKYQLGQYLMQANRPRETIQVLTQPGRWDSYLAPAEPIRGWAYFKMLADAHGILGEHEQALAEARRGRTLYPDVAKVIALEAEALAALGRLDELAAVVDWSLGQQLRRGDVSDIMAAAAAQLRIHGHPDEARVMAKRAVAWIRNLPDPDDPRKQGLLLAYLLRYAGELDEAARIYAQEAANNAGQRWEIWALGQLGVVVAAQGDRARALEIADKLVQLRRPHLHGQDTWHRARIAAQLGDKEKAVDLLRGALGEGLRILTMTTCQNEIEKDSAFDSLRGYPPFEELMKPRG